MRKLRHIGLFVLVLISVQVFAQNQDFGTWVAFKVSKRWDKKFTAFGEVQTRFDQNVTSLQNSFIQGGVSLRFTKWYELGGVYRYSNNGEFDANRFDIDNKFKYKINKHNSLSMRLKYTKSFVTHKLKGDRFRIRFKYAYKVNKKVIPYAKIQYFYTKTHDFSNWQLQRYSIGSELRVAKKNFIDVFFTYQFEFNMANPLTEYIFGVKYKLKYK